MKLILTLLLILCVDHASVVQSRSGDKHPITPPFLAIISLWMKRIMGNETSR